MNMNQIKKACLVTGAAEGGTELNAFDNALLNAGIGDINLIKVSSIVPPHVELRESLEPLPKGAFLPVVYTTVVSRERGARIAAGVGYGVCADGFGVIMEATGVSREDVEEQVRKKIRLALERRGRQAKEVKVVSVEHEVSECGCVVAACIFW